MNYDTTRLPARFWAKVDMTGDCWLWTGSTSRAGYGRWGGGSGGVRWLALAHRSAYEAMVGPIPPGLQIDHTCRTRACCNPAHLEAVTQRENLRRGIGPARTREVRAAITHCPVGHEYTEANTIRQTSRKGYLLRCCRACVNERKRLKRAE